MYHCGFDSTSFFCALVSLLILRARGNHSLNDKWFHNPQDCLVNSICFSPLIGAGSQVDYGPGYWSDFAGCQWGSKLRFWKFHDSFRDPAEVDVRKGVEGCCFGWPDVGYGCGASWGQEPWIQSWTWIIPGFFLCMTYPKHSLKAAG